MASSRCAAFTIVELLVVIAILGADGHSDSALRSNSHGLFAANRLRKP